MLAEESKCEQLITVAVFLCPVPWAFTFHISILIFCFFIRAQFCPLCGCNTEVYEV